MVARRALQPGMVMLAAIVLTAGGCAKTPKGAGRQWEAETKADKGPVEVVVRVDKKNITLAGLFTVQMEAIAEEGYEVTMPRVEGLMKDFGIRDWNDAGKKLDESGRIDRVVNYELEPFVSGKYELPAMEFQFRRTGAADPNEAERTYTVETEPIELTVISLAESDPNWKPEIAGIEGIMNMPRQYGGLWMWLGGFAAAGLLVLAAWLMLGGRGSKGPGVLRIPAHELAYQKLRELVAEDFVGQGRIKEFYERISNILRHYIEDRFELRAPERTTEEFLYELRDSKALEDGDKERLGRFMTHCDLVKFAKFQPEASDIQKTFDLVKDFIEKTRSDLKVVEQAEATVAQEGV